MGSLSPELSLLKTNKPSFVPKLISDFLSELASIGSSSERSLRVDEFMNRLSEEKSKIEMFKRELPLSMLLLNDAIEAVNKELIHYKKRECEDEKMKWMSSFRLWTNGDNIKTEIETIPIQNSPSLKIKGVMKERSLLSDDSFLSAKNMSRVGAFSSFQGSDTFPTIAKGKENKKNGLSFPGISFDKTPETLNPKEITGVRDNSVSSNTLRGISNLPKVPPPCQQQANARKQRRCWSPDLHKLFVRCLQQLGGPQVATPKQIRELMKIDSLTNDEVKSHLQKYRIHIRRVPNGTINLENGLNMEYSDFHIGDSSKSSSPGGPLQNNESGGENSNVVANSLDDKEENEENTERDYISRGFSSFIG